ncbi:MAG: phosphate acyltransferase, partial [Acholeplasmataceae bacterium]|nr:phosphate acyltransferase [Acholeplasmataceae bacterium]
ELAIYASVVAESYLNRKNPKVGLLNIGTEAGKGREVDKETFNLLSESKDLNFVGNIEPKELFTTDSDVLITDGFTGNMILKTLEGTAKGMGLMLKEEIKSSIGGKIGYLFMRKNLKRFAKRLDASEVGGAMIFGINAPVIKAHGSSDAKAILNAIRQARTFVQADIINKVKDKIKDYNIEGESN